MADYGSSLVDSRSKNLYGQETNAKLRLIEKKLCDLIKVISSSNETLVKDEICLLDGTILIRYNLVKNSTGEILNSTYYNLNNTLYIGDLTQLDNMICCCNKEDNKLEIIEFELLEGSNSVTLLNTLNLIKLFKVIRNGLEIDSTEYSVIGQTITFVDLFIASPGAAYNELVIVEYYKA